MKAVAVLSLLLEEPPSFYDLRLASCVHTYALSHM